MTVPVYHLHDLGPQAQMMSRDCKNERMAMILQSVAIGSMIIMAGAAAAQVLREAFGSTLPRASSAMPRRVWASDHSEYSTTLTVCKTSGH